MRFKTLIASGVVAIAAASAATVWALKTPQMQTGTPDLVAIINGEEVSRGELAPEMASGLDQAIAIDRYINKVVIAEEARKKYLQLHADELRGVEREYLSQLYLRKRGQEIDATIDASAIQAYYDTNVLDENYRQYKLKYMLVSDPTEVQRVYHGARNRTPDIMAKFEWVGGQADQFLTLPQVPYGMGKALKSLKKGEVSEPLLSRNGTFIFYVDDVREGRRPPLEEVTQQVRSVLVAQQLEHDVKSIRGKASIQLK